MILFLSRRCSRPRHHFGQSTDFFCIRFSSYVFFVFLFLFLFFCVQVKGLHKFSVLFVFVGTQKPVSVKLVLQKPSSEKRNVRKEACSVNSVPVSHHTKPQTRII